MIRRFIWLGLLALAAWWWLSAPDPVSHELELPFDAPVRFDSRLAIDRPPLQSAVPAHVTALPIGEFRLTPVAEFEIEARVLGRKDYRRGVEARLSPLDLALGWGPMARPEVLEAIRIRQSRRFYYWSTDRFPIPRRDIERNSANMHLIPAGGDIARDLDRIRAGQNVRLGGYLVNVDRDDGWRWRTSLTRDDTGAGACEIVLVTRVQLP